MKVERGKPKGECELSTYSYQATVGKELEPPIKGNHPGYGRDGHHNGLLSEWSQGKKGRSGAEHGRVPGRVGLQVTRIAPEMACGAFAPLLCPCSPVRRHYELI